MKLFVNGGLVDLGGSVSPTNEDTPPGQATAAPISIFSMYLVCFVRNSVIHYAASTAYLVFCMDCECRSFIVRIAMRVCVLYETLTCFVALYLLLLLYYLPVDRFVYDPIGSHLSDLHKV
ncbi:hypothetical protein V8G54_008380, partial [Vigna mungo]